MASAARMYFGGSMGHGSIFTEAAHRAGKGVQEYAREEVHSDNPAKRKQANFARMAKRHWKPL